MRAEIFHQIHAGDPFDRLLRSFHDSSAVCQKHIECIQQPAGLLMLNGSYDLAGIDSDHRQLLPVVDSGLDRTADLFFACHAQPDAEHGNFLHQLTIFSP